jgi:hypothetical protein
MFFTQEQIAAAEGKKTPSSPVKKKPSIAVNGSATYQPRQIITHDPYSALLAPIANDYVQNAYANWGLENQDQDQRWQISSKGKANLLSSQENIQENKTD